MSLSRRAIQMVDGLFGERLLAAQKKRGGGAIVLYHRVSPQPDAAYEPLQPVQFEAHCELLRRSFSILPLAELIERRRSGRPLGGCCAITFDDGYSDFLQHAHPILRRQGLPATHFLVLQSVLDGRPNWNWRANRLVEAAREHAALPPHLQVLAGNTGLGMAEHLGSWETSRRDAWLQQAEEELSRDTPLPSEPKMMRVEEIGQCDAGLISWGSHTVSHAMLGRIAPDALGFELANSRQKLREISGQAIDLVSYPNGSFSGAAIEAAREAGYGAALAVGQSELSLSSPLMALPRFDIGWMGAHRLRLELGGAVQRSRALRPRHSGRADPGPETGS